MYFTNTIFDIVLFAILSLLLVVYRPLITSQKILSCALSELYKLFTEILDNSYGKCKYTVTYYHTKKFVQHHHQRVSLATAVESLHR